MQDVYPINKENCRGCEWLIECIGDPDEDGPFGVYECDHKIDCWRWKKYNYGK